MVYSFPADVPHQGTVPASSAQYVTIDEVAGAGNRLQVQIAGGKALRIDNRSTVAILATLHPLGASDTGFPIIIDPGAAPHLSGTSEWDYIEVNRLDLTPVPLFGANFSPSTGAGATGYLLISHISEPITLADRAAGAGEVGGGAMQNPMTTLGDMIYGETGGAPARLGTGAAGQYLTVDGTGRPHWTALPSILTDPTTTNGDMIARAGGVLARLAVGANGQYLSVSSGAPTWVTPVFLTDPTTTQGDIIYRGAAALQRLGVGSPNTILASIGGVPAWYASAFVPSPLTTVGDLVYLSGGGVTRLPIGSAGQFLSVSGGLPTWAAGLGNPMTTNGDIITQIAGVPARFGIGTTNQVLTSQSGALGWFTSSYLPDPMTTVGDMLQKTGGGTMRLPIGTTGQELAVIGGLPTWRNPALSNQVNQAATPKTFEAGSATITAGTLSVTVNTGTTFLGLYWIGAQLEQDASVGDPGSLGVLAASATQFTIYLAKGSAFGFDVNVNWIVYGRVAA